MSAHWETRNITLPYWMGEICLFRKSFRVHTANADFINYDHNDQVKNQPDLINGNAVGYMNYSIPLDPDHKTLWQDNEYVHYVSQSFRRYYIDLNNNFDDYLGQFSSKTRSTFRRKVRKYEKEAGGTIDWRIYATPSEMEEFHKMARDISKETYQEKLLNAGLPDDEGFRADMMRNAENGTVRGFLLFLDGKPVSYLYAPIYQGRIIYDHLGYLPEVSRLSAGTVLFLKVLEYLFENDIAPVFDFTEGQSEQKKQFSTANVYCGNMISLKNTFSNRFWLWLNKTVNIVSGAFNRILDFIGIKDFLKKMLRKKS